MTVMVGTFKVTRKTDVANIFTAFGSISSRDFIFRENGRKWAFRNAGATVNTSIRVNIDPGPFIYRLAGNHTFNGTNVNATTVTNAQAGDDVSHCYLLLRIFSFSWRYYNWLAKVIQ